MKEGIDNDNYYEFYSGYKLFNKLMKLDIDSNFDSQTIIKFNDLTSRYFHYKKIKISYKNY